MYTKQAEKQLILVKNSNLYTKVKKLVWLMAENPLVTPPPYEKLVGDLQFHYSRRINNVQHRLVYRIHRDEHTVLIVSMWTHYE
jgi:Txe/YoeB family toxin of toxin-antitoxin system